MATPIPLNQPSKQVVVALINRDNNTSFTTSQIEIDQITVMPVGFARNTSVRVSSLPGSGFTPSEKTVYYNRLDLAYQWRNTVPVARANDPSSTADLLTSINNLYGLNITLDDVVDAPYEGSPHTVTAKADSFVWIGSVDFVVVPEESPVSVPLSEEFSELDSPGFVYDNENNYNKNTAVLFYEMLTEAVNSGQPYTPAHFSLSFVNPLIAENSRVTLTALSDTGFTGTFDVEYTRIEISDLITETNIPLSVFTDGGYSIGSTVPGSFIRNYINDTFGLLMNSDELSVPDIVVGTGNQAFVETTLSNYLAYGSITMEIVE